MNIQFQTNVPQSALWQPETEKPAQREGLHDEAPVLWALATKSLSLH